MPHFTRKSSAAITWAQDGSCHGIRLKRNGDKCRITAFWTAKTDAAHTLPETLADGEREIEGKDAAVFLAAPEYANWDAADVAMPPLPADQLASAMAFELRKHTPSPVEKLTWGYRQIAKATATAKPVYRLVYTRSEYWHQWCDDIALIAPVDAIVPAPVTLDPLFDKQTVAFPKTNHTADAYLPTPEGRVFRKQSALDADGKPIPLAELLAADFIVPDEFAKLPVEEQYPFADALILAIYGLTEAPDKDTATLMPLPDALRPHRSIALLISAGILFAVTLAALILYAVLTLQSNYSQQHELQQEIARLDLQIKVQNDIVKPDRLKKIQELQDELKDSLPNYPPFPLALSDISRIIDSDRELKPWISTKMSWNHDTRIIKFSVEEPLDDGGAKPFIEQLELIDELNDSPYIIEARGNSSIVNRNEHKTVRDFTVTLGWKSPEELAAAAERNAQRAKERAELKRQKEQARAKAKAEAEAQAQAAQQQQNNDAPEDGNEQNPQPPAAPDNSAQPAPPQPPLPAPDALP